MGLDFAGTFEDAALYPGELAMPEVPNMHALAAMLTTVVALALFSRDRARLEVTSLGLLAVLALGFSLFPFEGFRTVELFSGFGHEALIAVCALMVLGQGLIRTGALEPVGRLLSRFWGKLPYLSFAVTLVVAAALSAVINNTPIVVLLLPILISVCARTATSPSGVLMPMGLATLIGGMGTTIGTSTNLLVVSVAADLGMRRFAMFDFLYPAAIAAGVAILYLWLIAPRLLPKREITLTDPSHRLFEARLHLNDDSPTIGRTLAEAMAMTEGDMRVRSIRRGNTYIVPLPDVTLRRGDRLRVIDTPQRLKAYEERLKATLRGPGQSKDEAQPFLADNQMLAEIAVVYGSPLDRANLRFARFIDRFKLMPLALHRAGRAIWKSQRDIEDVNLRPGDVLLVQGDHDRIQAAKRSTEFLVLDASIALPGTRKAPIALAIIAMVIVLAATGILPIAVSAVAGVAVMLLTRCLNVSEGLRAISPSVFFVVVASLALGRALTETGATQYITELFLFAMHGASPTMIVGGLMLLLAILTNIVSNNAAAVIGTPIAIGIAHQLGLPPEPFVLAVLFGANLSYATPMAYQTNLLVMSAGNYRFLDFVKVGVPLIVLMLITLTWALSVLYL
ncbi:MAG: SLC13 family permease [Gammaproteobacteria bacterium]|nr:SLC13 family permease [Gammaproteobacteria bacterium]